MGWLGDHPVFLILLGIVIAYVVIRAGFAVLRMLGSVVADPDPGEGADVEEFDVRYRCVVCGTEIRLTRLGGLDDDEDDFQPPRHCREDMALVVEAEPRQVDR